MSDKHSPLPWRIEHEGGDSLVFDAKGKSLAGDPQYYPWTFDEDDTEFLVRAVNAHADMLKALEAAHTALVAIRKHILPHVQGQTRDFHEEIDAAAAAIAKAKGATEPDYAADFDRGPHGAAVQRSRENSVGCNDPDEGPE